MTTESIAQAIRLELARLLSTLPECIELSGSLGEMGLDSLGYIDFAGFVEKRFRIPLGPDLLFEHETVAQTIAYISQALAIRQGA